MKTYPEISGPSGGHHKPCYAFAKYDGSNMRFEWSHKQGWHKFGTRKMIIDHTHPIFGGAVPLFLEKYGDDLAKVFKSKQFRGVRNFVVFAEWFGATSLGGSHFPDDPHDIVVFDVNPHKKGFLGPKEFLDTFGHLKVAELLWQGNYGPWFIEQVKNETIDIESKYEIKSEIVEGVIVKGDKGHKLWMCKVKTKRYKEALKAFYQADWERFWE